VESRAFELRSAARTVARPADASVALQPVSLATRTIAPAAAATTAANAIGTIQTRLIMRSNVAHELRYLLVRPKFGGDVSTEALGSSPAAFPAVVRIRETHVRDHLAPLLSRRAAGAAKVDLVVRALAARHPTAGGELPATISWEAIHDIARGDLRYGTERDLKRKWVGEQLQQLELLSLVRRELVPGKRPRLIVLSDKGSGSPFDDPRGGPGDSYVSVLGHVLRRGWLQHWSGAALAAYIAAMIAERYARADSRLAEVWQLSRQPLGGGRWYRQLGWFADEEGQRPPDHVRVPFAVRTLGRGFSELRRLNCVASWRTLSDPRHEGTIFEGGPRTIYQNRFYTALPPAIG
jgi:hypothetical protein